jgi:hypothetical protein
VQYLKFITALAMLCFAYAGIGSASAEDYGTKDEAVAMVKRAIARAPGVRSGLRRMRSFRDLPQWARCSLRRPPTWSRAL